MSSNNATTSKPSRMNISIRQGTHCYFDVDDATITVWGSNWTGREKVWVDDQLVSSKLSLRFTTEHLFENNGHQYRVLFHIVSVASGHVRIELFRDGEMIDFDEAHARTLKINPETGKVDWWAESRSLLAWVLIGAGSGAIIGYLAATLPRWLS